jgi:hypothetical protein
MAFDAGLSFQPGQTPSGSIGGREGQSAGANPVQDAIRVLSLRIPKMTGQSPFPQATAPGMQGVGPGGFAALLRQLIQGMGQPEMGQPGMAIPSAPAPTTTPGVNPGTQVPSPPAGGFKTDFGSMGSEAPQFDGPTPGVDQGGLKPPVTFARPSFQLWR